MATFAAPTRKRATRLHLITVGESIPENELLGRLAFYSLPDEERSGALLMKSWVKHGLDEDALPDARQAVDVFRSACSSVKARVAHDAKTGQRIEILSNPVVDDGSAYQITVRRWDRVKKVIEHEKGMRVEFDKKTNAITIAQLDDFDPAMGKLATAIQAHFDANAKTVPGQKIRNAVRQTLLDIGAQNLRRKAGGLYFVPAEQPGTGIATKPILDGLAGVLEDLYDDLADFHVIPCANGEGEREIVAKHFAMNANEKAGELAEKAWARVRQGRGERGVRSDLVDNLNNERRALLGQIRHFEQLVQLERSDVDAKLDELDEALEKLDDLANESAPTP